MRTRSRTRCSPSFGCPVNVGIAPNKLLAKMASDFESQIRFTPCLHPKFRRSSGRCLWARCIRSARRRAS
ncbi:MAG: hypothetical protein ACLRXP_07700 [Oscillospiraceae bacterium]